MKLYRWFDDILRDFNAALSLPHDYDLPDEPSAMVAHLPAQPADASPLGLASECVDRSAAPVEEAGAVGRHTNWDAMRDDISFVRDLMLTELAQIDDRKHALLTAVDALDNIDPTPAGLASAVVDINSRK